MSFAKRNSAMRHMKECQSAVKAFVEAEPPVGGKILTKLQNQLARLERDYFSLLKDGDLNDPKTKQVLQDLQRMITSNYALTIQGKRDAILERQKILELHRGLNNPENYSGDYHNKKVMQSDLEQKAFGLSFEAQNKRVEIMRQGVYSLQEKIDNLPIDDPKRVPLEKLQAKGLAMYGQEKAQLDLNQMEIAGKVNPGDRKVYIDKRLKSLNTNPVYETDPVAKKLMEAECNALPKVGKEKFIENIRDAVRFDLLTSGEADMMNNAIAFKEYVQARLPKDQGYKVDVIPSGNNVLLKVSDGENTIVLKRGEVAGKLTDMGCDYKSALDSLPDKSGMAQVHVLTGIQMKDKNVNTTIYFEMSEFVKGENMGSYFKKMPSGTEEEILAKQSEALRQTDSLIDWIDELRAHGVRFFDLKCGNFMITPEGERKNPDFKSLIKTDPYPETDFHTSVIPTTFMTKECTKDTKVDGKMKHHYDMDRVVKTALATQLLEMLTLSDDAGTSPVITFGKISLNRDQPILQQGIGKEILALHDRLVNEPDFTLADAKVAIVDLQKKIALQQDAKLEKETTLTQSEVNQLSLQVEELKTEVELVGVSPQTEEKMKEVKDVLESSSLSEEKLDHEKVEEPKPEEGKVLDEKAPEESKELQVDTKEPKPKETEQEEEKVEKTDIVRRKFNFKELQDIFKELEAQSKSKTTDEEKQQTHKLGLQDFKGKIAEMVDEEKKTPEGPKNITGAA